MTWRAVRHFLIAVALAGCAQTTRVSEEHLSPQTLAKTKKAVAVIRVGAASPSCLNVAVLLGVRAGPGFRRHQAVNVANVRSVTEPAVAEVELDPGEYHVIAYACISQKGAAVVSDKADPQLYGSSYASFTLAAGEIVNVGYLHVGAHRVGLNAFGRPVHVDINVTDWPLAELDRYKAKRPGVYAQMVTRLMTVTPRGPAPPSADDCDRLRSLLAEGKVQTLPAGCTQRSTGR